MKELFVDTRHGEGEDGSQYSFDYYILIDQMQVASGFACESYGVKVVSSGGDDSVCIPNITTSVSRIDALTELLMRNLVTPCTLEDVVQDWL
jgi:hypothetical protein